MQRNVGLKTLQFYRLGSHPSNPDIMIAGSQDNGTMRTIDGGNSWTVVQGGDGMECFFDPAYPDSIVYASYQFGSLRRSRDGGQSFQAFGSFNGAWVTPFFIHPAGLRTVYAANNDVWRYQYNAIPPGWEKLTTGLSPVKINSLALSTINPDHMILSGFDYAYFTPQIVVMISNDGGYNWIDVTDNIPDDSRWISRVLCDPADQNTKYIVRCGFSEGNKIWKTSDLGVTWTNISGDLPDIPCNTIWINPYFPDQIFVGTDLGVYISDNGGVSYYYGGGDMPVVPIMDFDFVYIDGIGYLRVATHGRGIYETIHSHVDVDELQVADCRLQAFPNPCEGALRLRYQISDVRFLILDLFSISGLRIKRLLNEVKEEGLHELEVDMSGLPAGVYFCTLRSENGVETVKVVKY
jgi:hypothetical protein